MDKNLTLKCKFYNSEIWLSSGQFMLQAKNDIGDSLFIATYQTLPLL